MAEVFVIVLASFNPATADPIRRCLCSLLSKSSQDFERIRRLYNKDQEVIQQGSGGYTTRIRRLLDFLGIGASIRIG